MRTRAARLMSITELVGEYPLEVGLGAWGAYVGISTLLVGAPSGALSQLPAPLDTSWGIVNLVGCISVVWGLIRRKVSPAIANAMGLFSVSFAVYAIAVIGISGWSTGGAVTGLTAVLSIVCLARARRLRKMWQILLNESERLYLTGSMPIIKANLQGSVNDRNDHNGERGKR